MFNRLHQKSKALSQQLKKALPCLHNWKPGLKKESPKTLGQSPALDTRHEL